MKPLTKKQKAVIAQLAARAHKCLVAVGCPVDDLSTWRREEQASVTGHASMQDMTQRDYVPLCNHFIAIGGGRQIKDNTYTEMDKAIHRLRDIMARHELTSSYLWAIVKDQFPHRVTGHNYQDLWGLIQSKFKPEEIINLSYTLNNRGRARTTKIQHDHNLDGIPTEPHADPTTIPPGGLADHFNSHHSQS